MADDTLATKLEQLLSNNREPKVSELRTALLGADAHGGKSSDEARLFMRTKVSGGSQALMSFCDLKRLYAQTPLPPCEMRAREAGVHGGLVAGVGLFATRDIQAGDIITEWEVHGISSTYNNDAQRHAYYDPRIVDEDDLTDPDVTETKLADEALSLSFDGSRFYHFPLALTTCPYKLAHFANDVSVCPDPDATGYEREDLIAYKESATQANATFQCSLGFRAVLVSRTQICAGDEILVYWGANHWAELRRMHNKGMRLAAMKKGAAQEEEKEEEEVEEG